MNYHDEIITITLCRGELAASLGERGLMVRNWSKLKKALERALRSETPSHDDGHTGSSAVGDLLLNRAIEQTGETFSGIDSKPDSGPNECWPFDRPWFDGSNDGGQQRPSSGEQTND
jgi:hypothetical protein